MSIGDTRTVAWCAATALATYLLTKPPQGGAGNGNPLATALRGGSPIDPNTGALTRSLSPYEQQQLVAAYNQQRAQLQAVQTGRSANGSPSTALNALANGTATAGQTTAPTSYITHVGHNTDGTTNITEMINGKQANISLAQGDPNARPYENIQNYDFDQTAGTVNATAADGSTYNGPANGLQSNFFASKPSVILT